MKSEFTCEHKEESKLYKIGQFAQLNRITIKTLRYYDDVDVLKPAYVDEENGYRYYSSAQLPRLYKILALRDMNFSIEEIRQILNGAKEKELLQKKRAALWKQAADITAKIACVDHYLSTDFLKTDYRIVIKSLPEVCIAYQKVYLKNYADLFMKMPDMGMAMEEAGCICAVPDYCFTVYDTDGYQAENIYAEICQAVTAGKEDHGNLHFKVLPEVETAACVLHKGPYSELPKAYGAIVRFLDESGYEIAGLPRECYIDGIWNKDTEEDWLTEIQFPLRKREE